MAIDLYAVVVCNCGIQPAYFLDEMEFWEAKLFIERDFENYKNEWEQTRYIAFIQAWSTGNKVRKPIELVRFEWEELEASLELSPQQLLELKQDFLRTVNNVEDGNFESVEDIINREANKL